MFKRWMIYLSALMGCFIFFISHGQLISWMVFLMVVGTPLLSLIILLLHSMFLHPQLNAPVEMTLGQPQPLQIEFTKPPALIWTYDVEVHNTLTGHTQLLESGDLLPANHCGQLQCSTTGLYILDPLGLFRIKLMNKQQWTILVKPTPVAMPDSQNSQRQLAQAWKPKAGGGYSERHDLRLYRPGDSLNQIHWKLSAKTGKYIIREAMVPNHGTVLLSLYLRGTPEKLDEKIGQLLWMGQELLAMGISFRVQALTGDGTQVWDVAQTDQLIHAIFDLLRCPPAAKTAAMEPTYASWHCHIGGDLDEK